MMTVTIAPLKPQTYEAELAELRLAEDALFVQAMTSPEDEMLNQFTQIWERRKAIYEAMEANMTPMPSDLPLTDDTAKSVSNTCTLAEYLAVPKPGKWKFVRCSFLPACWLREDALGRYDALPDSIVKMYRLTPRQIAILEGKIKVEKSKPAPAQFQRIEGALEDNGASQMERSYERYYDRISR